MPKMILEINDKKLEFVIMPINQKTEAEILKRIPAGLESRAIFLNHIVREPKMTVDEWYSKVPSGLIGYLIKAIDYYIKQISSLQSDIIMLNGEIENIGNEIDGLIEYSMDYPDEYIDERLNDLNRKMNVYYQDRDALKRNLDNFIEDRKPLILSKKVLDKL